MHHGLADEAPFADLMMGEQARLDLGHGNEQDGNEEMVEGKLKIETKFAFACCKTFVNS